MHDGGIFANAVSLSLVPAAVAGVLALGRASGARRCGGGRGRRPGPSGAIRARRVIAVTTAAWWAGCWSPGAGRTELRRAVRGVAVAARGRGGAARPRGGPGLGQSARTATGRRTPGRCRSTVRSARPRLPVLRRDRPGAVAIPDLGAAAGARRGRCGRRAAPRDRAGRGLHGVGRDRRRRVVSPGTGVDALVTRFYYHAMLRTWSHVYLLAPVLAGLGVVLVADRVAVLGRRRVPLRAVVGRARARRRGVRRLRRGAGCRVRPDRRAVGRDPLPHARVRPDRPRRRRRDRLARRAHPARGAGLQLPERRLDLPLRRARHPRRQHLHARPHRDPLHLPVAAGFNTYPTDPAVRRQLADLDVRWVYVDTDTPRSARPGRPRTGRARAASAWPPA